MKAFVDSNLLIYLNTVKTRERRIVYENFYLDLLSKYKLYTDVLVLDELIYVSRRKYNIPYEVTLEFIRSIVLPYVAILPLGESEYERAAELMREYGLKPSDALHVGAMLTNDISNIVSEDHEYDKLGDIIERVWMS